MNICENLTILIMLKAIACFQWMEFNNNFDCAVGISFENKPISVGVFISRRTVITAANPLNLYLNATDKIKIHTIFNSYKNSINRSVENVAGNQSFRKQTWVTIGYNRTTYTSIHDLVLVNVVKADKVAILPEGKSKRLPYLVKLPDRNSPVSQKEWTFVGFGYIDPEHIEDNEVLEATYFNSVLTDCDEWIPREWGRFLCLIDEENLGGVASGAPLFRTSDLMTVYGIGSFALKKGKDKILVFTDLRPYVNKLYGYVEDDR